MKINDLREAKSVELLNFDNFYSFMDNLIDNDRYSCKTDTGNNKEFSIYLKMVGHENDIPLIYIKYYQKPSGEKIGIALYHRENETQYFISSNYEKMSIIKKLRKVILEADRNVSTSIEELSHLRKYFDLMGILNNRRKATHQSFPILIGGFSYFITKSASYYTDYNLGFAIMEYETLSPIQTKGPLETVDDVKREVDNLINL